MKRPIISISVLCAALCGLTHAEPTNGLWQLSLAGAVKNNTGSQPLTLNVATQQGKGVRGIVQGFNSALHDVDVTALKAAGRTLKGVVKVTLNADNWLPADKKPISCEYTIEATAAGDGVVTGKQAGKFGASDVAGEVTGKFVAGAALKTAKVQLRLDSALNSQKAHLRSAVVSFDWRDDKAVDGKMAWTKPDKFHWTGRITALDVHMTAEGLSGTITAEVATGALGEVEPGKYVFTLDGVVAGNLVAGKFKAKLADKDLSGGTFAGTVK